MCSNSMDSAHVFLLGRKMVTNDSDSDLPLVDDIFPRNKNVISRGFERRSQHIVKLFLF